VSALVAFERFEVARLLRSWKFLAITVGFPVVFYMLFLNDHSPGKVVDGTVTWRVYLMVSMCSFGALVAASTPEGAACRRSVPRVGRVSCASPPSRPGRTWPPR